MVTSKANIALIVGQFETFHAWSSPPKARIVMLKAENPNSALLGGYLAAQSSPMLISDPRQHSKAIFSLQVHSSFRRIQIEDPVLNLTKAVAPLWQSALAKGREIDENSTWVACMGAYRKPEQQARSFASDAMAAAGDPISEITGTSALDLKGLMMSDNFAEVFKATNVLLDIGKEPFSDILRAADALHRVLELCLVDRGALLRKLAAQLLAGTDEEFTTAILRECPVFSWTAPEYFERESKGSEKEPKEVTAGKGCSQFAAMMLLVDVAPFKAVPLFLLKKGLAEQIFRRLLACTCFQTGTTLAEAVSFERNIKSTALKGLCSFGLVSRKFRASIRAHPDIFRELLRLLSGNKDPSSALRTAGMKRAVSLFLVTLAASESYKDTRLWLLEQGFVQAMVGVCRLSRSTPDWSVAGCTSALFLLLQEAAEHRDLLRQQGAVKLLTPVSGMLHLFEPSPGRSVVLWQRIRNLIQTGPDSRVAEMIGPSEVAIIKQDIELVDPRPVACTWHFCESRRECKWPYTKALRRCASCGVAYYCR
jgi:hypothetical protein